MGVRRARKGLRGRDGAGEHTNGGGKKRSQFIMNARCTECKVTPGETTAMHVALKMLDAKTSGTPCVSRSPRPG